MNRMYPGRMDGTQTDRASYLITTQVVEQADHVIDFHGGDIDESLRPYSYWNKTGRADQDAFSRGMVLAFGLDHIVISADRPKDPNDSRYFENTATTRGKPSIIVEAGHAGTVESDDVAILVNGTISVMRHLKMLPGAPQPADNPVWIDHLADVAAEQGGIFYPLVKRGAYVNAGMKIGYVTDYVGKTLFEARAKEAGVAALRSRRAVNQQGRDHRKRRRRRQGSLIPDPYFLHQLDRAAELEREAPARRSARCRMSSAFLIEPAPQQQQPRLEVVLEIRQAERLVETQLAIGELGAAFALVRLQQLPQDARRQAANQVFAVEHDHFFARCNR